MHIVNFYLPYPHYPLSSTSLKLFFFPSSTLLNFRMCVCACMLVCEGETETERSPLNLNRVACMIMGGRLFSEAWETYQWLHWNKIMSVTPTTINCQVTVGPPKPFLLLWQVDEPNLVQIPVLPWVYEHTGRIVTRRYYIPTVLLNLLLFPSLCPSPAHWQSPVHTHLKLSTLRILILCTWTSCVFILTPSTAAGLCRTSQCYTSG